MSNKKIDSVEEYELHGTDYVSIKTRDGWIYRFARPRECEPYRYDRKQRPNGEFSDRKSRTPAKVIEYMENRFDTAQLHPERRKHTRQFNQ